MSQVADFDVLKEIPGYKAILKSVIKTQIQLLIEQLSDQTGEESIILTACINEGTLSHLGSNRGKGFMEGRDEIKSQFLGYCLKSQHRRDIPQPRTPYQEDYPPDRFQQGPRDIPQPRTPYQENHPPDRFLQGPTPKRQKVHPVSIARVEEDYQRSGFIPDPGSEDNFGPNTDINPSLVPRLPVRSPVQNTRRPSSSPAHSSPSLPNTQLGGNVVKIEANSDSQNSSSAIILPQESPSVPPFQPTDLPSSVHLTHTQTQQSYIATTDNGAESKDSDLSAMGQSGDSSQESSVKIEPITENEMELEITGVEMAGGATSFPGDWGQDMSGGMGYQQSESGDSSLDQSGNQYKKVPLKSTLKTEPLESTEQNEDNDTVSISSNSSYDFEENDMYQEMQGDKENSQDEHTETETEIVPSVHDNGHDFDKLISINSLQADLKTESTETQLAQTSMISENGSETTTVDKQTDIPPVLENETDTSNDRETLIVGKQTDKPPLLEEETDTSMISDNVSETKIVDKQVDIPPHLEDETDTVGKTVVDTADIVNPYSSSVIENYVHIDSEKQSVRIERVDASQTDLHKTDSERNTQEVELKSRGNGLKENRYGQESMQTTDQEQKEEIDKDNVRNLKRCTAVLKKGVKEPSGRKDYDLKCIKCHQTFSCRSEKESHEKKCFSDRECSICSYTGRHKTDLADHMVSHTGEKRYSCPKCNMRFKYRKSRINHVSKCSGSRPVKKSEEMTKVEKQIGRGKVNSCKGLDLKKSLKVNHRRLHNTKESDRKCKFCGKVWSSPAKLREHLPFHTGEKNFSCSRCGLKFKWRYSAQSHEKKCIISKDTATHTKVTSIKKDGNKLPNVFNQDYSCKTKRMHVKRSDADLTCKYCGKIFTRRLGLEEHLPVHTGEKNVNCRFCDKAFKYRQRRDNHEKNCTHRRGRSKKQIEEFGNGDGNIVMTSLKEPHLMKKIIVEQKLNLIVTTEKAETNTGSVCKLCGKFFSSGHHLEQHVLTHTNIKPFSCTWCLMRFKSSESLGEHQRFNCIERKLFDGKQVEETYNEKTDKTSLVSVLGDSAKKTDVVCFPCKTCGKKFKFRKSLQVHMERKQCKSLHDSNSNSTEADKEIELDSTQLDKNDDTSSTMKDLGNTVMKKEINRRQIMYTKEQRIHPCPLCSKKFTRKDSVEKHLKVHFGVSHFTCKYCNMNFKSFTTLNNHKVVAHSHTDKTDKQQLNL